MRSSANFTEMSLAARLQETARYVLGLLTSFRNRRDVMRLAELDDRILHDIGLTRSDVLAALAEPVHRDPSVRLLVRRIDARTHERRARSLKQDPVTPLAPAVSAGR